MNYLEMYCAGVFALTCWIFIGNIFRGDGDGNNAREEFLGLLTFIASALPAFGRVWGIW